MILKGSKTEENLKTALMAASLSNRRFMYFAAKADVEGFTQASSVFRATAEAQTGHAQGLLDYLSAGDCVDPQTGLKMGSTIDHLKSAVWGAFKLGEEVYPQMAQVARNEGFTEMADWFETLAKAEKAHGARLQKAMDSV
jgi:rubrerythrin